MKDLRKAVGARLYLSGKARHRAGGSNPRGCIFDFSAREGLGRQLEDSRRPECRRGAQSPPMLHAADMAIGTDALCTGTGAGPAPRLSSSESATDDGAVPCTFFVPILAGVPLTVPDAGRLRPYRQGSRREKWTRS